MGAKRNVQGPEEIRFAVVMNGGVSLAVWMGGVARELDLIRRASCGQAPTGDAAEARLHQLWAQKCGGRQVVVDLIAGTSAGGLNGALLASAIASGGPIGLLKDVWRVDGALEPGHLLKEGHDGLPSVLDGDRFGTRIEEIVRQIRDGGFKPGESSGSDTRQEVTLFVTATALAGKEHVLEDSFKQTLSAADHRRRYAFQRRTGRLEYSPESQSVFRESAELNPDHFEDDTTLSTLALAARASAGFPLAFAPKHETVALAGRRTEAWVPKDEYGWLADGGILDNAPFAPILEEVARRPVAGAWRRILCYVVPSADDGGAARVANGSRPAWTSVLAATVGLPREADLRDDVEEIAALLRGSGVAEEQELYNGLMVDPKLDSVSLGTLLLLDQYRNSRAQAGVTEARRLVADGHADGTLAPPQPTDFAVVLPATGNWLPRSDLGSKTDPFQSWTWGLAVAERTVRFLLRNLGSESNDEAVITGRVQLSERVEQAVAVREAFAAALLAAPEASGPDGLRTTPELEVAQLVNSIFARLKIPATLARVVRESCQVYAQASLPGGSQPDREALATKALQAALTVEIMARAASSPTSFQRVPGFEFLRLGPGGIGPLLSLPAGIDPATFDTSRKLYGTHIHHFGAFGKPSWRMADWLWGRLDAVTHIAAVLGLSDADILELQTSVLEAEGKTVAEVQADLDHVLKETDASLIDELKVVPEGSPDSTAAEFVAALLRFAEGAKDGRLPPEAIVKIGHIAAVLLAEDPPHRGVLLEASRLAMTIPRDRLWDSVRTRE